ncbi:RDD family protein [Streptomyces sp. JJ36]|uniref:RDD family protein n=1 Tax=Streptomyces sp. JJ36 TaxID=2736645 RepID=UPI001F2B2B9A|nr:RDD family protein [Streptomyces sp. JJ36]MCF6523997.1 RDD family protein [Streptomyces sp. JJ36]
MSELVTGDAVVLGLRPARLPSRALAVFVDLLLYWSAFLLLSLGLVSATASLDAAAMAAVQVALLLLVLVGVPIAVETLSNGRSVGKAMSGLRVVRADGGPIRFRHALVRQAIGVVEIQLSFGVIACTASLVSARGRRVGDVFAGTLVIRERVPAQRGTRVPSPPPWLAGQFAELDLSRVPEPLWLAVRQYLMRSGQLDEGVSLSMAQRLAADVAERTGAPMPPGMPPGVYLAGVVAERQAREARRAFGPPGAAPGTAPGAPGAPVGQPADRPAPPGMPGAEAPAGAGPRSAGSPGWYGPGGATGAPGRTVTPGPATPPAGAPGWHTPEDTGTASAGPPRWPAPGNAMPAPATGAPAGAPGWHTPAGTGATGTGTPGRQSAGGGASAPQEAPREEPAERPRTGFVPPA